MPGEPSLPSVKASPLHLVQRGFFALFGLLCVAVGFVGFVTPGLPGTVFLLIALWAFRKSSSRLEAWLLNNKLVGPTLRDWEQSKSIKLSTKIVAIAVIWLSIGFTIYRISTKPPFQISNTGLTLPKEVPMVLLAVTMLTLTWYLASRKTKTQ
jgi:uncharacterized protein